MNIPTVLKRPILLVSLLITGMVLPPGLVNAQSAANGAVYAPPTPTANAGQSITLLPSGGWLVLGGSQASITQGLSGLPMAATGQSALLTGRLSVSRTWHTATMLPTGKVLVFGGIDAAGTVIAKPEIFDPSTQQFQSINIPGLTARARHTATVLSTGEVLIAGGTPDATPMLWNPRTNAIRKTGETMLIPRSGQSAALLSTSPVLIWGGVDEKGVSAADVSELYQRQSDTFEPGDLAKAGAMPSPASLSAPPAVAETIPSDKARNVSVDTWPAVRFSRYLDVKSLNSNTVTLYGPNGPEQIGVNAVEAGLLVFVAPAKQLQPDSDYTLFVRGATDPAGEQLIFTAVGFHTAVLSSTPSGATTSTLKTTSGFTQFNGLLNPDVSSLADTVWQPNQENFSKSWRLGVGSAAPTAVPMLQAARGVTAISGQVLLQSGKPLAGVAVSIGNVATTTDSLGRFLVRGIPKGHGRMIVNARTANSGKTHFGQYVIGVDAAQGQTTLLNYVVWMPVLDEAHAVSIDSPTKAETVVTSPLIPGLELHIPKGAVLREADGSIVTKVSITPVPLDRPPFPTPDTPGFFTIQPGGAYLETVKGSNQNPGMKLIYPNSRKYADGTAIDFMNYDPDGKGWYVYGKATVNAKTNQILPNDNVAIYQFMGAMYGQPNPVGGCSAGTCGPPPKGPNPDGCKAGGGGGKDPSPGECPDDADSSPAPSPPSCAGDPVDCATGLFVYTKRDLYLPDTIPIDLTRTYNSGDTSSRNFGVGITHPYHMWLYQDVSGNYYVIQPNGSAILYKATTNSTVWAGTSTPGKTDMSTLTVPANYIAGSFGSGTINLKFKTGYTYQFSTLPGNPLTAIVSPAGQVLRITVDFSKSDRPITSIVSPNGRSLSFTYVPGDDSRIATATDNTGRTISYTYDSSNRLSYVTYPDSTRETYTYTDAFSNQLQTVTNGNGHVVVTNTYTSGRVTQQQRADNGTFTYQYTNDANGNVVTTVITDPLGNQEQMTFDTFGYLVKDIQAYTTAIAQTTIYTRDAVNGDRVTKVQDPQGRVIDYTYDAMSNVKTLTLEQTPTTPATVAQYSYEATCNLISSFTDPLGVKRTYNHDSQCNLTQVVDNQNVTIATITPDSAGRPRLIKDAQGNQTTLTYSGADLTSVTDPLNRTTIRVVDGAGRLQSTKNALGEITNYTYDPMDRLTSVTDALGHQTTLAYDDAGNLTKFTDPRLGITQYAYYNTELLQTRTDPLGNSETYTFDANFNLTQFADRNGKTDKFTFDALNRLTDAKYATALLAAPGVELIYTYGINGSNLVTQAVQKIPSGLTTTSTTVSRSYDGLDRLLQETFPSGSVVYTYYANGLRNTLTASGQSQITYCYDGVNRPTSIVYGSCVSPTTVLAGFSYDSDRRPGTLTLPNGVTATYSYDNSSELTGIAYAAGATALGNLTYGYNGAGRLNTMGGTLGVSGLPAPLSGASFNANNQLTTFGSQNFNYDKNGNLISDGTNTYVWDALNHLVEIETGSLIKTQTFAFSYEPFGRRASKTVGSRLSNTVTNYVYDGFNKTQEVVGGTTVVSYLNALGIDSVLSRTAGGLTTSYLANAQGSTAALTNSAGAIQTAYQYDPYGEATSSGTTSSNDIQYTGRENDGSGLIYSRARYYSPTFKRFLSEDPIGYAGGVNIYAYVRGNPVGFVDPLGLADDTITDKIESYIAQGDTQGLQDFLDSGGLSSEQEAMAQAGLRRIDLLKNSTDKVSKLADKFNRTSQDIKNAIHQCKRNLPKGGPERNPDVLVDLRNGEVYPQLSDGTIGDSIGNLLDFLP